MMKKISASLSRDMIRPAIYMFLTRFGTGLCAALLLEHLVAAPSRHLRIWAFTFLVIFFAVLAWIAYLRLDGVHLPKIMMFRYNLKKKPMRTYGDIYDHLDDKPVTFEELDNDQKDVCILFTDILCAVIFLILAI